jgi:hypothetical protein
MLDHMLPDDITQGIGIPLLVTPEAPVAAMERDLSYGFRTHPSRLAWFIANQNVKEGAGKSRNMLLRKQRCDLTPVHGEDEHPSIKISNIKLSFRVR